MEATCVIGIDVSKDTLAIAVHPSGEAWTCATDPAALEALIARVMMLRPTLVVCEATGGYEMPLAAACAAAGVPLAIVNPRQVRAFAQALGQLAKTDAIDATVLALFAARVAPPARPVPDAATQALAALVARRRQLLDMLGAEQRRLAQAATAVIRRDIATFLRDEVGSPAEAYLDEVATTHTNPAVRKRAADELKKYQP